MENFYDLPLAKIQRIKHEILASDIPYKEKIDDIAKELEAVSLNSHLPSGPIHVDVKPDNVLFEGDILSGVLDFDNAYIGPFILDVAKSMIWFGLEGKKFGFEKSVAICKGYEKIRPLTELEKKELVNVIRFAFFSHVFIDYSMYVNGKTELPYFEFIVKDFNDIIRKNMDSAQGHSINELRARLQKTAPEGDNETYVGRTVRFFSIYLTKILVRTNLTPNEITVISIVIFFTGVSAYLFQSYFWNLAGVFFVYLSIVFDACDGEIARLRGNKSGIGGNYVEPLSHDIQYGLMFLPLTMAVYFGTHDVLIVYVGFTATVSKLLCRFLLIRFETVTKIQYGEGEGSKKDMRYVSFPHKVYKFFNRNIFSSVGLVTPLLLFSLIDRVDLFIWFFALGFLGIFLVNFIYQIRYISRKASHD